jgi:hypothetical protein
MILEVCDKLPLHWYGWWTPHAFVAGFCALCGAFGGMPGRVVGSIVAACWSAGCLVRDLSDPIFTPDAIVDELGPWTYALHVLGMLLPAMAIGLVLWTMRRGKLAI